MTDFVQLQNDLCSAAQALSAFSNLPVLQWRKLRLQAELDMSAIWLSGRNGRSGAGIVVEMPEFDVQHPNLPGPEAFLVLNFLVLEEPNSNFAPSTGTLLSAEQICQLLLEQFHDFQVEGFGTVFASGKVITTVEDFPGIVGYRVSFRARVPREQTARVQTPVLTEDAGSITMTCATAGAQIYYTVTPATGTPPEAGSFPGPTNPDAKLYETPFTADVGDVIRAAAYLAGAPTSHVVRQTVT